MSPARSDRLTVAVVGAGPRGTSFLERLLAVVEEFAATVAPAGDPWPEPEGLLNIVVIDPYQPGPGHVWRTEQSELFLMNTPSFYPTVAAVEAPGLRESSVALTFDQWRMANPGRAGVLDRTDYPPRSVYGHYLEEMYREVVDALTASAAVGAVEWRRPRPCTWTSHRTPRPPPHRGQLPSGGPPSRSTTGARWRRTPSCSRWGTSPPG